MAQRSTQAAQGDPRPPQPAATILPLQLKLLHILSNNETKSVNSLMKEHKIGLKECSDALEALRQAGLIELMGEPGAEAVSITPQGLAVQQLA